MAAVSLGTLTPSPHRPRLLFVIGGEAIGGMETHLLALVGALGQEYEIGVCCLNGGSRFVQRLEELTVATFNLHLPHLQTPGQLIKSLRLKTILRRFSPDIVQTYGYTSDVLVPLLCLPRRGKRVVTTRRGQDGSTKHQRLRRLTTPFADRIICVSQATADFVRQSERTSANRITVIPNGVSCRSTPNRRTVAERIIFGTLGNVKPVKGTDILLRAFLNFPDEANVELRVAGGVAGPWATELVRSASASTKAGKIHFSGFCTEPREFLNGLDVFVLPSRSEGMSNALLEAMACGLPCVVTDVGSNAEVVRGNGVGALVCRPEGAELFRSISALYADPELRTRLGAEAHRIVRDNYSIEQMVDSYRHVYDELLQPRR